jgi:hypothetical protein
VNEQRHCIVCGEYGVIALGIRGRYENTNAVWAPNLNAYLCDEHARSGCEIEIELRPTNDGRVRTTTSGPRGSVQQALVIGTGRKEVPGQEQLIA